MSLARASRSEFTKQFTTSIWWILAIALVAYVAFTASVLALALSASATGALPGAGEGPQVSEEGLPALVYSAATSVGYVFPLLIGTLMVTTEFRHKTLTPTFLATPRRFTALFAKVVVGVLLGALYAVLAIASSVGPGAAFLAGFGLDAEITSTETWSLVGRMVIAFVLWVLVGIGVGTLVRNQVVAIVIVLVFTQFLEPVGRLLGAFVEGLSDFTAYLPGAASDALVGASVFTAGVGNGSAPTTLEWWAGGLTLLGYAAVFLVIGYFSSWRRDVT
ncbi:MAG TPA: ABC transporter permease [Microbacterium sp.]|uniref:ABC transporter permease n=1 Tax=Microbacterium sp. TaxID=51671 RepID=UPI002D00C1A8|nr:ABC transporter permease [Microbacterium sp.]HWI32018.1 ABC transporter permease [Microbacterium sp.]